MQFLFRDILHSLRTLTRQPGFSTTAILTLALGIGCNTAVFSVADVFLFRPLPFKDLERLVMVLESTPRSISGWNDAAPANFVDWKRQARCFEHLVAYNWKAMNLTGEGDPERLRGFAVSPGFFETLGISPALGRTFLQEEEEPGKDAVVLLSFGLWQRRFGGDARLLGRTVQLDGRSHAVVGIMPASFDFPPSAEFWKPLALTPRESGVRNVRYLLPMARLKAGVSREQAAAEMAEISERLEQQYPNANAASRVQLVPLRDFVVRQQNQSFMRLLMGASGLVLLIACANVSSLQFARASARQREMAIRLALGASRGRLLRLLLNESVLFALLGCVLGCLAAVWAVDAIRSSIPPELAVLVAGWKEMSVNGRALAFSAAISILAGVFAGLWPALRLSRTETMDRLRTGGRTFGGRSTRRARNALVIAQASLAIMLLAGAGLISKGFAALMVVQPGLKPESLLTFHLPLPESKVGPISEWAAQHELYLERLRRLAGLSRLAAASTIPYQFVRRRGSEFSLEGEPPPPPNEPRIAQTSVISVDYFDTFRIPLQRGRAFTERDRDGAAGVAIVSEAFAHRYFGGRDPVGQRIKAGDLAAPNPWISIVGVAGDVRDGPFDRQAIPLVYRPYLQAPVREMVYALRAGPAPLKMVAAVRAAIQGVDPDQPVFDVMTMQKRIANRLTALEVVAGLMTALGALALVLSTVGLYGVIAFVVSDGRQEIGIRMAFGARPADILVRTLGQGLTLAGISVVVGLAGALALGRLLASLIFGVSPSDSFILVSVPLLLTAVALCACYLPARRAAGVDPAVALRSE